MGGSYQWPSIEEVWQYRQEVRQAILDMIDSESFQLPVTPDHPMVN